MIYQFKKYIKEILPKKVDDQGSKEQLKATLGLDDLTVSKCFRVIFTLKKQTIQFSFLFNPY